MSLLRSSDAATLRGAATVVRNGRHVTNERDAETGGLERSKRALATGAGALHEHRDGTHAVLDRATRRFFGGQLSRERRALAGSLEALRTGARPRHDVARDVGNRHDRVVERRLDVRDAR